MQNMSGVGVRVARASAGAPHRARALSRTPFASSYRPPPPFLRACSALSSIDRNDNNNRFDYDVYERSNADMARRLPQWPSLRFLGTKSSSNQPKLRLPSEASASFELSGYGKPSPEDERMLTELVKYREREGTSVCDHARQ